MKKAFSLIAALLVLASLTGVAQARGARRPANDDLAAAAAVPGLPFSQTVSLKGATLEPDEVQPSCQKINGSVWFAFSVAEPANVVARLSSSSGSAVAVFEQTVEGVTETACSLANSSTDTDFRAEPERAYLVQVGSTGAKQGAADLGLGLSEWVDETLWEYTYHQDRGEQHVPLLSVKGAPREDDPKMYDVQVGISEQQPIKTGILTFGLVDEKVEAELLRIPPIVTELSVTISSRYDSSQYTCAADDGQGTCHAPSPVSDLNWLTSGEGCRAELVITIRAARNGDVLQERSVSVPYAGQPTRLLP